MTRLNPYVNFQGNTEEAFKFYQSVFGGELSIVRFKDMAIPGVEIKEEDKEKIMHISLPISGEGVLMGTDALESMGHKLTQGNNVNISIHPDSKEEADKLFYGLSEGGTIEMPIADQMWGDYYGSFRDKFGIQWMINYSYPKT